MLVGLLLGALFLLEETLAKRPKAIPFPSDSQKEALWLHTKKKEINTRNEITRKKITQSILVATHWLTG